MSKIVVRAHSPGSFRFIPDSPNPTSISQCYNNEVCPPTKIIKFVRVVPLIDLLLLGYGCFGAQRDIAEIQMRVSRASIGQKRVQHFFLRPQLGGFRMEGASATLCFLSTVYWSVCCLLNLPTALQP
jgi:hypothetical protein